MRCNRCGSEMSSGEEREHFDQILCEDCYMDALSPVRTCDPWAVHSAKSFAKHTDEGEALTPIQSKIIRILKETGGIEPPVLLLILGAEMTPKQLEREFATLRHMEKVRGEKRGDRIFWRLW